MLLDKQKIKIKWSRANKDWYINKGYIFANYGDELIVNANDLSKGCHKKVKVKCDYCGKIIDVVWKDYYNFSDDKYSCKECRQTKTSEKNFRERQLSIYQRALKECKEKGYELITSLDEIEGSSGRIQYRCPKHVIHETSILSFVYGKAGCPECQIDRHRLKPEEVKRIFNDLGGIVLNENDYIDSTTKNLKVICPVCGKIFFTSYNSFIMAGGQRCPVCSKSESKGEYTIRIFLENHQIKFEQEYTFNNCKDKNVLPFDFYLPDYNKIIEYDGKQHYSCEDWGKVDGTVAHQLTVKHDNIKNNYCKDNNISLLRIPYWEYSNIDTILHKELNLHEDIV